jgi:hypothetical protein
MFILISVINEFQIRVKVETPKPQRRGVVESSREQEKAQVRLVVAE